jgi:hypothetical protein
MIKKGPLACLSDCKPLGWAEVIKMGRVVSCLMCLEPMAMTVCSTQLYLQSVDSQNPVPLH